ncbi:UvrD-helicase domain-containing protein [Sulfurospirillum arcachonense]|uniref:UvrD-helicase domain-containing protein n=1 Tax=Sulfurospirillum arcachonense TaxID=57666 RepID=UPI0004ADE348|nr:UvrD-helicase domain-containing protein [Sulfurospirillum arcachonense]
MSKINKLIIAAAGAGKTTYLIKEALKQDKEVLITTYTEANESEIKKKFIEINGAIPKNVTIQTWFSMLLQHGVKPYQDYLTDKKINGMLLVNEQSGLKFRGKFPVYYKEEEVDKHYFSKEYKIYSDKLSKFVFKCNEKSKGVVFDRISRIYEYVFIDEVQDLAGYDLELIKLLFQTNSNIVLVGDSRQVTYLTHHAKKYPKYKDGKIKEFIQNECKRITVEIDEESLNCSYRNNELICKFSSKLFPDYAVPTSKQNDEVEHKGIFFIREKDIDTYLAQYQPLQLVWNRGKKVNANYSVMNFGESKGLGFDRVLIYPTQKILDFILKNKSLDGTSRAKFYVAITRARHSVGIVYTYLDKLSIDEIENWKL